METIISQRELEELKKIKGEVRGISFATEFDFLQKEQGSKGVARLEKTLAELGYPLSYEKIKKAAFYPLWQDILILILMERLFGFDKQKFYEMGKTEAKVPFTIRIFMKYFSTVKKVIEQTPGMWRKFFTVGELKVVDYNLEERRVIMRLEDFFNHPLMCYDLAGYFASIVGLVVGHKTQCRETKCIHRGDQYHEFLIEW